MGGEGLMEGGRKHRRTKRTNDTAWAINTFPFSRNFPNNGARKISAASRKDLSFHVAFALSDAMEELWASAEFCLQ